MEFIWKFEKNVEFLTSRMFASSMIRVFQVLGTPGHVRIGRQFVGLCVSLIGTSRQKHNRAKSMSASASAIFSLADAGEFQFARFYIVCEEVPLGTPESPPIVRCVGHAPVGLSKRGRDRIRCKHSTGRNTHIFLKRIFHLHFHMKSSSVFLYNIAYHLKEIYACATVPLFNGLDSGSNPLSITI